MQTRKGRCKCTRKNANAQEKMQMRKERCECAREDANAQGKRMVMTTDGNS